MERRTLAEGLWVFAFGAIAQPVTGATAALRGDDRYFQVLSHPGRLALYLVLLGALNVALADDLGTRAFGRALQRGLGAGLIVFALLLAFGPQRVAALTAFALCFGWLAGTALWLRPGPEWSSLQRAGLVSLLGFFGFDMLFDIPLLLVGGDQARGLSILNNTVHNGTLVHVLWIPLTMALVAGTVIRGCIVERTRYDFILLALFAGGATVLVTLIDPLEEELAALAVDSARAVHTVVTVDIAHVGSTAVVVLALWLLGAKRRRTRTDLAVATVAS